jgi:hypothetical protein
LSILAVFMLGILISLGFAVYNKTKSTYVAVPESSPSQQANPALVSGETPAEVEEWEVYFSEKYQFSFEYPKGDFLIVEDLPENRIKVEINSSNIIPTKDPDGSNLVKGYIYRVIPYKLAASNLENAVNVKRDWFLTQCPETATISEIEDRKAAEINGRGFEVYDCNSDYYYTYVTANDYIFEIARIFKGDVGYKQVYKSRVNQILSSTTIDINLPELSPNAEYSDRFGKFSFNYPREMDLECCTVPGPPDSNVKSIVTMSEKDNQTSIGFFINSKTVADDFYTYVNQQKTKLIDEYTIIKNKPPEGVEETLTIGGRNAVKLADFSWRGNDLIFVSSPRRNQILMISYMDVSEEALSTILNSITFF